MMNTSVMTAARAAATVLVLACAPHAVAQAWPAKSVRMVIAFSPGGGTDIAGRLLAKRFTETMGQTFVADNRAGAGGLVGAEIVAKSPPDGYNILVTTASLAVNVNLHPKLAFDPIKDLAPIGGIGITPTLLVAAKSVAANDLNSLVQLSKERPGGLSFSTAGYGLLQHLAVEEMSRRADARFTHVVYKGGAQAATDLIAARVDFGSFAAGSVIQFVKEGQLKPLGVIAESRSGLLPDVPTTAEQGLPGFDAGVNFMLYAPAATSKKAIAALNTELNKIVGDLALRQRFADIGFDPTAISPETAAAIMRKTADDWAPVIRRLNIRLD